MKTFLLLLSVILLSGCFTHAPIKQFAVPSLEITGEDFDVSKLQAGGKLAVIGFRAGPQAEANDFLDQISAMLQRGIEEKLKGSTISVRLTDQVADADFVLEGYVEEFYTPGQFSRLVMRK